MFEVKASTPIAIKELEDILKITPPKGVKLYLYGFRSLLEANALHQELVDGIYLSRLRMLKGATDLDLMICPESTPLSHYSDPELRRYYLQVEKALQKDKNQETQLIPIGSVLPEYMISKFEGGSLAIQKYPLEKFLHQSLQAPIDLHSQVFIFKDEACYRAFQNRVILSPTLNTLYQESNPEERTGRKPYNSLLFMLRNILKFRYLGWKLSGPDRTVIEMIFTSELKDRFVTDLKSAFTKYPFLEELRLAIGPQATLEDCFLKETTEEKIKPILYQTSDSTDEMLSKIRWVLQQKLYTDDEKIRYIRDFCDLALNDNIKKGHHTYEFCEKLTESLAELTEKLPQIKSWMLAHPEFEKQKKLTISHTQTPRGVQGSVYNAYNLHLIPKNATLRREALQKQAADLTEELNRESPSIVADLKSKAASQLKERYTLNAPKETLLMMVTVFIFYVQSYLGLRFSDNQFLNMIGSVCLVIICLSFTNYILWLKYRFSSQHDENTLYTNQALARLESAEDHDLSFNSVFVLEKMLNSTSNHPILDQIDQCLEELTNPNRRHALMMAQYFGFTVYQDCELGSTKMSQEKTIQLMVEVAAHFNINDLDSLWKYPLKKQDLIPFMADKNESSHIDLLQTSITNLKSHLHTHYISLPQLRKLLTDYAQFLLKVKHTEPYRGILPGFTSFLINTQKICQDQKNPALYFRLIYHPLELYMEQADSLPELVQGMNDLLNHQPNFDIPGEAGNPGSPVPGTATKKSLVRFRPMATPHINVLDYETRRENIYRVEADFTKRGYTLFELGSACSAGSFYLYRQMVQLNASLPQAALAATVAGISTYFLVSLSNRFIYNCCHAERLSLWQISQVADLIHKQLRSEQYNPEKLHELAFFILHLMFSAGINAQAIKSEVYKEHPPEVNRVLDNILSAYEKMIKSGVSQTAMRTPHKLADQLNRLARSQELRSTDRLWVEGRMNATPTRSVRLS